MEISKINPRKIDVQPLSNFEIERLMYGVPGFEGVYAHNQIDSLKLKPKQGIIYNLEDTGQPGTHWVAIFIGDKHAEYFDSFGLPPDDRSLKCLQNSGKEPIYSDTQIQENSSIECGYYTMAFIRERAQGVSYSDFMHKFKQEPSSFNERLALILGK